MLNVGLRSDETVVRVPGFNNYQREDGGAGPVGADGSSDSFNLTYMTAYAERMDMLMHDPQYRFVRLINGFMNGNVFEVIDQDTFSRGIEMEISRAKEQARVARSRGENLNELRKSIADLEKQKLLIDTAVRAGDARNAAWKQALTEFDLQKELANVLLAMNGIVTTSPITAEKVVAAMAAREIDNKSAQMFDLLARIAFHKYGPKGLLNKGFAGDMEQFFRSLWKPVALSKLEQHRPLVSDVALYLATLKALATSRGLLAEVATRVSFEPGSAYAVDPTLFADDAFELATSLMPDSGESQVKPLATFEQLTLIVFALLNNMIRRATRKDGAPRLIAKPSDAPQSASAATSTARKTKRSILGNEVLVNVDDANAHRAATNENRQIFTEEQYEAYRKQLFVNNDVATTMGAVARLLRPLFLEAFGRLFFVDGMSDADRELFLDESRYPVERSYLARDAFTSFRSTAVPVAVATAASAEFDALTMGDVFSVALFILGSTQVGERIVLSTYERRRENLFSHDELFAKLLEQNRTQTDWLRYEKHLRDQVVKRTVLPTIAKLLLGLDGADPSLSPTVSDMLGLSEGGDITLPPLTAETLRSYVAKPTPALAVEVLNVYDTAIVDAGAAVNARNLEGMVATRSNEQFETFIDKHRAAAPFPVPNYLRTDQRDLAAAIDEQRLMLQTILTRTPEEDARQIEQNLRVGVTRRWASQPFNSGIIVLSARCTACIAKATDQVRDQCPNLAGYSDEELQLDPAISTKFASLVTHRMLRVNNENPGEFLRDSTTGDLKVAILDDIQALRRIRPRSRANCMSGASFSASLGGGQMVPLRPQSQQFSSYFS